MIKKFTHSSRKKEKIYLYIFPAKLIFLYMWLWMAIGYGKDGSKIWTHSLSFSAFTSVGSWVKTV